MASHLTLLHAPPLSIPTKTFHSKHIAIKPLKPTLNFPSSSSSFFQCSSKTTHRGSSSSFIAYSSSNGRSSNDSVDDAGVKSVEQLVEEKKRAELSARIASGEFTVKQESGLNFGPKSFLIVSDPAIAKHILKDNAKGYSKGILAEILDFVMGKGLIPADGEIWKVRRRTIVPALHLKFVAAMIGLFGQATDRLCKKLDAAASDGEDVEMESLFSRLTLDIIGKAAVYTVLREAEDRSVSPIPVWDLPIWKDISPRQRKVAAALKLVNDTLNNLIAICKRMVDEEELQFHEEYMNEQDPSILHFLLASGDDVTSKQLRDDLMTMLIAGHETSAAVLTWTFYLLSKEPSVMSKLQEEVDSVLGDRFPTIEDMKKLKYTTRVINESLRLYPQPPVLIRRSLDNDVLGEYPIKRGEDIFISVWNLHRSPTLWDGADKFDPERWPLDGPNPNETNQNFKYLPFGGGPRKCIGDMFASYETIVALAMLVRRFNFQMAIGAPPVVMTTGATIHTTQGLNMTVTRRTKPPIVPSLQMSTLEVDPSISISDKEEIGQKDQVYQAQNS
ncbi:hypothetical protein TSUD_182210 [Trifolium subterraneum]|uniref:Cytochrome P450 n=1 Tax=Trifolium subterraneum TaxID=3900 RepID=A0A2Z6LSD1_TRISU|nr:hypothetical protein TSUD_182210 [Trifolium subterraneum]